MISTGKKPSIPSVSGLMDQKFMDYDICYAWSNSRPGLRGNSVWSSWSWLLITQLAGFSPVRAVLINIFSLWGTRHDVIRKWCDDVMMFDMLANFLLKNQTGQGNYAAANSSLDAFAPFWSSKGRSGLRVQSFHRFLSDVNFVTYLFQVKKLQQTEETSFWKKEKSLRVFYIFWIFSDKDQPSQCSGVLGCLPRTYLLDKSRCFFFWCIFRLYTADIAFAFFDSFFPSKWRQKWVWQFRRAQCSVPKPVALALSATPKAGNFVDKCGS